MFNNLGDMGSLAEALLPLRIWPVRDGTLDATHFAFQKVSKFDPFGCDSASA